MLIYNKFRSGGDHEYAQWLGEQFAEHVFRGEELQKTVEAAARLAQGGSRPHHP